MRVSPLIIRLNPSVYQRSGTDNLFVTHSVIERNKYLGKPTYLFFADAEKCFDKMWLDDAVIELWRQGTNIRDAIMIRKMNNEAKIVIHTPVGVTDEISCESIVRQGTVYGPQMCGSSMSRVNDSGRVIATMYGPKLIIRSTQFVDDVSNAGSPRTTNNTIENCRMLEETKKMTFNNTNGKTEYVIANPPSEPEMITSQVKKGNVNRVYEHKSLGMWIDEKGTYDVNIEKNKKKIPHMIASVKAIGSTGNVGRLAAQTRLKLVNTVIMPSILYNVEVVPRLTSGEIDKLEKMQHKILTEMLEVPRSTPYKGILMETGMWTMEARIEYKKLMLFHNIKNSEDSRIIKQILEVQEDEVRDSTWLASLKDIILKYGIELDVNKVLKSGWKKKVKEKIQDHVEQQIRAECHRMKKTRSIKDEKYELQQYMKESSMKETSDILRTRLHMNKLPCNYGDRDLCKLCGYNGQVTTEHYFTSCHRTTTLSRIWQTKPEDIRGNAEQIRRAKNFIEKVEVLMERYINKKSEAKSSKN